MRINVRAQLRAMEIQLQQAVERGQHALVNQVYADTNMYVPMKSTDLRNQSQITADGKSLIWNTPYAARLFYNQYSNYTTPGTGPRWDLKAEGIHKESWKRVAEA